MYGDGPGDVTVGMRTKGGSTVSVTVYAVSRNTFSIAKMDLLQVRVRLSLCVRTFFGANLLACILVKFHHRFTEELTCYHCSLTVIEHSDMFPLLIHVVYT